MTYKVKDIKLSIRHNSWLVDSKMTLEHVLELIYLWSQGFTHSEVMHKLKLSKRTVTEWFMFCREACIYSIMDESEPIGGNGVEVEIDESKFGKHKYHWGHRVEGQWVFGGHKKYNKQRIFMIPVNNRKAKTSIINKKARWLHAELFFFLYCLICSAFWCICCSISKKQLILYHKAP